MPTKRPEAETAGGKGQMAPLTPEDMRQMGAQLMRVPAFVDTRAAAEIFRRITEAAQSGTKDDRDQQLVQAPVFLDLRAAAAIIQTIVGKKDETH